MRAFAAAILLLLFCLPVQAATNTVTSLAENGPGTLAQVIDASTPGDTIVFGVTGTLIRSSELILDKNMIIAGHGASLLAISGGAGNRIFNISSNARIRISGLTLRDGQAPLGEPGGAVYNRGDLTLSACVIANNSAGSSFSLADRPGGSGGGIYNTGLLSVEDSVITGNRAGAGASGSNQHLYGNPGWPGGNGGGICSEGWLSILRSTISNNVAGYGGAGGSGQVGGGSGGTGGAGGGIHALTGIVERCSVVNNQGGNGGTGGNSSAGAAGGGSGGHGGGVYAAVLLMTNSTIAGNFAGGGGDGGIRTSYPTGQAGGGSGGDGGGLQSEGSINSLFHVPSLETAPATADGAAHRNIPTQDFAVAGEAFPQHHWPAERISTTSSPAIRLEMSLGRSDRSDTT